MFSWWSWLWCWGLILHRFFFFIQKLIIVVLAWMVSPPWSVLHWLTISCITIERTVYLLIRELEVDLFWSHVDDCLSGVEEWSSKHNR
jgi:hypothetical protein